MSAGAHDAPGRAPRRRPLSWEAVIAGAALGALLLSAMLAGPFSPYDPLAVVGPSMEPPSVRHRLGTNDLGQDLLSLLLHGARVSLGVGFAAALLSTALSAAAGLSSVLWRAARLPVLAVIDALLAVPHLPVIVLVVALLGPGLSHLLAVLVLLGWPAYARVVRAQALTAGTRVYVEAARALGASGGRILRTCLLPEVLPLLWTKFLLTVRWAILMEATLALMGLGDPSQVSWGTLLQTAFSYPLLFIDGSWAWWAMPPALGIAVITVALSVMGRDFEAWLNPASRAWR